MRFLFHFFLMSAVALLIGFGLSWYALTDGRFFGAIEVGPWQAWYTAGAPNPDPYARAYLARTGALQLGQSEGLQFISATDSDGQRLDRACRYRVDGTTPTATFWTLAPIGAEGEAITRPDGPLAFNSRRIARANDGSMQLYVSRILSAGNWLEIAGDGPFSLVLTLYDTTSFGGVGSQVVRLPSIIREACS